MSGNNPSDRGLLIIARANITAAKRDISESGEVWINLALFNITQAAEKTVKYLCSCNGIEYQYDHYMHGLIDKLLDKGVKVPELVQENAVQYGRWATQSRYTSSQLVQRRFIEKHIECIDKWISSIEKQMLLL